MLSFFYLQVENLSIKIIWKYCWIVVKSNGDPVAKTAEPQQGPGEDEELGRLLECDLQAIKVQGHDNIQKKDTN